MLVSRNGIPRAAGSHAAIERTETGYTVRYDHCKGCGLCVEECPTGAVLMRNEERL